MSKPDENSGKLAVSWLTDALDDLTEAHDAVRVLVHLSESTLLDTETQRAVAWLTDRIVPHIADARTAVTEAHRILTGGAAHD